MKKILAALFSFALCWNVQAFTEEEIRDALCSLPVNYLLRIIGCVYDQTPESIRKYADAIYQCVDEYYENNGKSDSILLAMCNNYVQEDEQVTKCLEEKLEMK